MLLSKEECTHVAQAIAEVEKHTDAELVTVLARRADDYRYIPLMWAALLSLLVPLVLVLITVFLPVILNPLEILLAQWTVLVLLALLFHWPPLQLALVPRSVKRERAANLARRAFLEHNLHHTHGDTGVLVFVSEAEHYVEIIADRGISRHVPDEQWQGIVDAFTDRVRRGDIAEGFLECINACGDHLIKHVPVTSQKNELPNHLVVL